MTLPEHTALAQLGCTAVLIVGSAMGTAYKIIRKLDEVRQSLTNHCKTCIERHERLDIDVRKIDTRLGVVEIDLTQLTLAVAEHRALTDKRGRT